MIFSFFTAELDGSWMKCHSTGEAELAVGPFIVVLGVLTLIFSSKQTRLGLSIDIILTGIFVLFFLLF